MNYEIGKVKKYNREQPKDKQVKFEVRNKQLFINNELKKKFVIPPTVRSIVTLSREEYDRIGSLEMLKVDSIEDSGSVFSAYGVKIKTINRVANYYKAVQIWHPECDHIMMAYRINDESGCCDNGEHSVGLKMQRLMED